MKTVHLESEPKRFNGHVATDEPDKGAFLTRFEIGDYCLLDSVKVTVIDVEVTYAMTATNQGDQTQTIRLSDGYKVLGPIVHSRTLVGWFDNYKVFHKEWLPTQCLETAVEN